MSLINDALKKAQKQRTGDAAPLSSLPNVGGESPAHLSRGRANTPGGLYVGLGLGAIAVVGLIIAAILLFRSRPAASAASPTVAEAPAPARPSEAAAPVTAQPEPAASPAAKTAETMFVVPIPAPAAKTESAATSPGPRPASETKPAAPTAPAAVAPAPVAMTESPAPTPATPGRMDPRAVQFLDGIKVAGIRASATDSKVLMNDRVYRVGDMVGYEFGVRLVGITANSLTFEDAQGARYTRNF